MDQKEKVKDFNYQSPFTLRNKMFVAFIPLENFIIAYYAKDLPLLVSMWVKRS